MPRVQLTKRWGMRGLAMSWKCCMLKKRRWFCLAPQPYPCHHATMCGKQPGSQIPFSVFAGFGTFELQTYYMFFVKWVDISNNQTLCAHHFTTCFTCAFLGSCCSLVVLMEPQEMAYKVTLAWQLNQGMTEVVHDLWAFKWMQIEWSCKPYMYCTLCGLMLIMVSLTCPRPY